MIELTELQRIELKDTNGCAVLVSNPVTHEEYFLVPRHIYERLASLADADVLATGEHVDAIMAEDDANDPYLASYQSITRESPA